MKKSILFLSLAIATSVLFIAFAGKNIMALGFAGSAFYLSPNLLMVALILVAGMCLSFKSAKSFLKFSVIICILPLIALIIPFLGHMSALCFPVLFFMAVNVGVFFVVNSALEKLEASGNLTVLITFLLVTLIIAAIACPLAFQSLDVSQIQSNLYF